jgi:hypothetical protein
MGRERTRKGRERDSGCVKQKKRLLGTETEAGRSRNKTSSTWVVTTNK